MLSEPDDFASVFSYVDVSWGKMGLPRRVKGIRLISGLKNTKEMPLSCGEPTVEFGYQISKQEHVHWRVTAKYIYNRPE